MLHKIPTQRDAVNTKDEEPYLTAQHLRQALSFKVDDVIFRPPHVKIVVCFGILTHPRPLRHSQSPSINVGHVSMLVAVD